MRRVMPVMIGIFCLGATLFRPATTAWAESPVESVSGGATTPRFASG